ncbi:hypothetical protein QN277_011839 [Acacia crassicarpa]|uniref:Uncharacterized protein n=1 Tax=Acacia crassicarpa TaxID=499986 RepID=A0AAE1MZE7_9FABA|nr:hypothetical protein QN277_011839 [Acacia crassicarpa]
MTDRYKREIERGSHGGVTVKPYLVQLTRSPLLGESSLVSFPPLIDMLKLSGRALGLTASGATCVQRLNGSQDSTIHTKYRISLRSSSMREPRYLLPRVISDAQMARGMALGDRCRSRAASERASLSFSVPWRLGHRGLVAGGGLGHALALPPPSRLALPPPSSCSFAGRSFRVDATMILPQVHLRKPCYDFSFL